MMKSILILFLLISCLNTNAQNNTEQSNTDIPFVLWYGKNPVMNVHKLAAYCAPIFWFSSDEPELKRKKGKDIRIPSHFPFETDCDSPVVYYQFGDIIKRDNSSGKPVSINFSDIDKSVIDLASVSGFTINYSHYYKNEAGLGGHKHDTEQGIFKFSIRRKRVKDEVYYVVVLQQATAKAHALEWYDNIWTLDTISVEAVLPFHILVEEGKHASCTDINGDGIYTPGYDVNVRTNDAWGLRDVIRTGRLFTSEYNSYLSKQRLDEYRVFPPLPEDSPLRKYYSDSGVYSPGNAVYKLRHMPNPVNVKDVKLRADMEGYYLKKSFNIREGDLYPDWLEDELAIKSFGISYRIDNDNNGFILTFPLLIVKNVELPLTGGWIVNRILLNDTNFRDWHYSLMLTPSASRFLDPYFAAGVEVNRRYVEGDRMFTKTSFVLETGIKIRANVTYSPFKFLSFLSPFWGVRVGIKNTGFPKIEELNYIFEIGAGVW